MIRPGRRPAAAPRRPRAVLLIGAVAGAVALAGCGAGQVAQTAYQANNGGGADVGTGDVVQVRAAQIAFDTKGGGGAVYRTGGSAPVEMRIINQSNQDDRLLTASSPIATSVQISGATDLPAGTSMVVGGAFGTAGQDTAGATEAPAKPRLDTGLPGPNPNTTIAPSSTPAQPSDTPPTSGAPVTGEAPAAGIQSPPPIVSIQPNIRSAQMVLAGLREDIKPGLSYPLVLNFQRAGAVTVQLPVSYPGSPRDPAQQG